MAFDRSIAPAARTAFDVAIWFLDRARADDCHLPLQTLHRLLFLAQSHFAVQFGGLLMPAVFLAEESGPVEPNLQLLLAGGRPEDIRATILTGRVREFLGTIWDRHGHMPAERLNDLIARNKAYTEAGRGGVIDPAAMAVAVTAPPPPARLLRSQSGAPVAVRAWMPTGKPRP